MRRRRHLEMSIPAGRSACITAFMAVASAPTVPASPTPLAPSGLVGDGTGSERMVKSFNRSACGMT